MKFDETTAVFDSHAGRSCPGAAIEIRRRGRLLFKRAGGRTSVDPVTSRPVDLETVFDLASLTKPLSTALIAAVLMDRGDLDMSTTIGDVFGAGELDSIFSGAELADRRFIDTRLLLCHTAGFAAWLPFAKTVVGRSGVGVAGTGEAAARVMEMALRSPPAGLVGRVIYSDVGYILLGMMLERLGGAGICELFEDLVAESAGITGVGFRPVPAGVGEVEADLAVAATAWCPLRERIPQGEVHDDNAWLLGGAAGHAGMFGRVSAVADLVDLWIAAASGKESLIGRDTARSFVYGDFTDPAGTRTPGFDRPAPTGSNAGDLCPAGTVGHLGFTGTSFWFDRDSGVSVILLTNRVNPDMHGRREEIRTMRRQIYDAAWRALS